MSDISYAAAFLVGTFLECVMYGVFFALLIAACYVQWDKYLKGRGVNHVVIFTTVFFGLTITAHCVLSVYRSIRAIFYAPPGVTVYEFLDPPYPPLEIVRLGLFQLQITVADVILAHRMYHIYERNPFICVIPSITITGLFVVGCGMVNRFLQLSTPQDRKSLEDWSLACFCLTIFNSLFMTVAISFRLWRVHRETTRANVRQTGSVILRAMKVLIESAALWTAFVTMNLLAFLAKSNLVGTFLAMTGPAVGISFCLIIVRMGQIVPKQPDESWHISIPIQSTRAPRTGRQFSNAPPNNSKVDNSDDATKIVRASFHVPPPMP